MTTSELLLTGAAKLHAEAATIPAGTLRTAYVRSATELELLAWDRDRREKSGEVEGQDG